MVKSLFCYEWKLNWLHVTKKKRNDRITVYFEPIFPVSSVPRLRSDLLFIMYRWV